MKPRTLRTTLTVSYAGVLALLMTALGLAYYRAFARQLDLDATAELREITSGVHGYLRFPAGVPTLMYDRNDPEQVTFVQEATRYYQIYDASSGRLLAQSPALEPLGLHYTQSEVRAFEDQLTYDVQTDRHLLRISNSVILPAPGEKYLLQVGVALDQKTLRWSGSSASSSGACPWASSRWFSSGERWRLALSRRSPVSRRPHGPWVLMTCTADCQYEVPATSSTWWRTPSTTS